MYLIGCAEECIEKPFQSYLIEYNKLYRSPKISLSGYHYNTFDKNIYAIYGFRVPYGGGIVSRKLLIMMEFKKRLQKFLGMKKILKFTCIQSF